MATSIYYIKHQRKREKTPIVLKCGPVGNSSHKVYTLQQEAQQEVCQRKYILRSGYPCWLSLFLLFPLFAVSQKGEGRGAVNAILRNQLAWFQSKKDARRGKRQMSTPTPNMLLPLCEFYHTWEMVLHYKWTSTTLPLKIYLESTVNKVDL